VGNLGRLLLTVVIFAAVWSLYARRESHRYQLPAGSSLPESTGLRSAPDMTTPGAPSFHCDGRTYCSQMTSCAEAKYFLARCPNVRMDGDHNGVPCERQWCPSG
jgi:hypothetical protein